MAFISAEREVELSNGKTVSVHLEIEAIYDSHFGADGDGGRGVGRWLIDNHSYEFETEDDLTDEETAELDELVEALAFEGDWDWDNAGPDQDEDFEEDFF